MAVIPDQYQDLLTRRCFAHLATINADGSPQVTPVWILFDGQRIEVNSARGRLKDKNMKARPRVSLSLQDPDNAYRYLEVRGKVVQITEEGGQASIDAMAKKYEGHDRYQWGQPGEVRVRYLIEPTHCTCMG